jgi:SAM-dependent methyltransferase
MIQRLQGRDNLLDRSDEAWRPPIFHKPQTFVARCAALARRMLDLQAASIWNDLGKLLGSCRGDLLDVGCGAQPYRTLLPSSVRYTGIDSANAKDHFGYIVPDTLYFDGDQWPVPSSSMDIVLATETLEHVPNPAQFLEEAKRCLKADGYLILTVPFAARWHYIPHDYWRFTPSGIRQTLPGSGFVELIVYARGNEVTVSCYKSMALILAMLFGQYQSPIVKILAKIVGVMLLPALALLALVGQLSLRSRGGNDCLGYTVVARRSHA